MKYVKPVKTQRSMLENQRTSTFRGIRDDLTITTIGWVAKRIFERWLYVLKKRAHQVVRVRLLLSQLYQAAAYCWNKRSRDFAAE